MRILSLIALPLLPYSAAVAQLPSELQRDPAFEQQVLARQTKQAALMRPEAETKLSIAVNAVLAHLAATSDESDVSSVAFEEVNRQFRGLAGPQSDLLSFYVLAELSRILATNKDLEDRLASMDEMSEMTSLRLQMMLDRRSRFFSTLSNLMKKISSTQDQIVQNLK
jgi:hypothetical protein